MPAGCSLVNQDLSMKFPRILAAIPAACLLSSAVFAQAPAQPAQTPMTQQQINEEMLKELKAIHALLDRLTQPAPQAAPQPTTARLTDLKGYALGRPDAPLTMVEFTDLQCPFCRQYATVTFAEIKKNWIDTGKLRYISHDFPLDFHPHAMVAARAARCAGEQGKFWDMRLSLVTNANLLSPDYITKTANDLKLDSKAFASCSASSKFDADIEADLQEGARIGVGGTPTFVLGKTTATTLEGPMIVGAMPYAQFDTKLKELLAK
jgi:protein-disulfide isomerase